MAAALAPPLAEPSNKPVSSPVPAPTAAPCPAFPDADPSSAPATAPTPAPATAPAAALCSATPPGDCAPTSVEAYCRQVRSCCSNTANFSPCAGSASTVGEICLGTFAQAANRDPTTAVAAATIHDRNALKLTAESATRPRAGCLWLTAAGLKPVPRPRGRKTVARPAPAVRSCAMPEPSRRPINCLIAIPLSRVTGPEKPPRFAPGSASPVTPDPSPASAARNPVTGHPDPPRLRRHHVRPRSPDIARSTPGPKSRTPHVVADRGRAWQPFDDGRRGRHTGYNGSTGKGRRRQRQRRRRRYQYTYFLPHHSHSSYSPMRAQHREG